MNNNKDIVNQVVQLIEVSPSKFISFEGTKLSTAIDLKIRRELSIRGYTFIHNKQTFRAEGAYKVGVDITSVQPHVLFDSDIDDNPVVTPVVKSESVSYIASATNHEYVFPKNHEIIMANLKCAKDWINFKSVNLRFVGMHGSGKTEYAYKLKEQCGFSKVYHVNGRRDMSVDDFFGSKTVTVDEKSMQNYISFQKGPLYRAFIHGTEVDDDGNQILYNNKGERVFDDSGVPRVVGAPSLFFLDEYALVSCEILTSVLNRAMEIPRKTGDCRSLEISDDGGRIVKSHPGFAMVLSGNTWGKGLESDNQMGYTSQEEIHDDSTLSRITMDVEFRYNLKAEKQIVHGKLRNERMSNKIIDFVKQMRKHWQSGIVETIISTRDIVKLCDEIHMLATSNINEPEMKAINYVLYNGLREKEKHAWRETVISVFGNDLNNICDFDENEYFNPVRNQ